MGPTELLRACKSGDADQLNKIIASSDREFSQAELDGALVKAAYHGHSDIVGLLLSHGAQITNLATHGACSADNVSMFQHFIEHGFDVNMVIEGDPVLRLVTADEACTRLFLENGANPNVSGRRGATPLSTAIATSSLPVMELLVSYGAELPNDKRMFLDTFVREGDALEVTRFSLDHGLNPNTNTGYGPPLHLVAASGEKELVQCLLEYGADRSTIYKGRTPAEVAEANGWVDIARLLSG